MSLAKQVSIEKGKKYWVKWALGTELVKVVDLHEQEGQKMVRYAVKTFGLYIWPFGYRKIETIEEFWERMIKK